MEKNRLLVTGAHDAHLCFWDIDQYYSLVKKVNTGHVVYCLLSLQDTEFFLESGNSPYKIGAWTLAPKRIVEQPVNNVVSVLQQFRGNLAAVGFFGGDIIIYDVENLKFQAVYSLKRQGNVSSVVQLSPEIFCTTSRDGGYVSFFDLYNRKELKGLKF